MYIKNIAGWVPDHCNKVTITIKQVVIFLGWNVLPSIYKNHNICEVQQNKVCLLCLFVFFFPNIKSSFINLEKLWLINHYAPGMVVGIRARMCISVLKMGRLSGPSVQLNIMIWLSREIMETLWKRKFSGF